MTTIMMIVVKAEGDDDNYDPDRTIRRTTK